MITSLTLPQSSGKPSVQDNMWCIAYSDNSGAIDMKYVFDVWVNNQQVARTKVYPEPSNGRGYFDAAPVVRNEMVFNWFDIGPLFTPNNSGEISINYEIRAGEDVSGVTTTNYASGSVTAFNWVPNVFKRRQLGIKDKDNTFVTNRNLVANAGLDDNNLLVGFHSSSAIEIKLTTYGFNNSILYDKVVDNQSAANEYYQLNISPPVMNFRAQPDLPIDENVKYYVVGINNGTEFINYTVNLVCDHRYTPIPLHFMNSYGMFETARFSLVSRLSMDVERKTFTKNEYTFNNTSVDYYNANNVYNESKINYGSKANWQYKLTMDYPSDAEYQWLNELITSPQIYAEIADGIYADYYPVTIKETNYEYSKHSFNGLKVFEVTIELNQTRYGFRR
jgi:hypothetical protein